MDFVTGYKNKLAYFRIKELKDVLTQLGIGKQGRKQVFLWSSWPFEEEDLVDRILVLLSDEQVSKMQGLARRNYIGKEGVAKIIDDTYRKMQIPGATELASKGQTISDITSVNVKDEVEDSFQLDDKVQCPCGSSLHAELMVQCEDLRCRVRQHTSCVVVLEKPSDTCPPEFYCEICRINRADPFLVTVAHPMYPVKLTTTNVPTEGTNPLQNVEKTFQLTRADRDLLQKPDYDVQAWCILLNDKVPFRMQWPLYPDLQVNGLPVRTINRPGSQLLGASGRDDGPIITTFIREGINKISLSGCDARVFCLGLRIVKRLTVQQVLNLIPKEPDGESFDDALTRVRRCIGGGTSTDNGDSDSDVEVVADSVPVNLRCPMSGSRIKIAGRFKPCRHMGCFDLETFVELNERSRKWQCPICLNNFSLENVIIDTYFNRITKMMHPCGEDVIEIDVKPDGSWRAKNENVHSELGQWHFPDGTLCFSTNGDVKPNSEALKFIKQESGSEGLSNGFWDVSKHDVMHSLSSGDQLQNFENNCRKVMPTSSSTTGSGRDGEDPSVSQDGVVPFNFSLSDGLELDSFPVKYNPTDGVSNRNASAPAVQELIILSDSDENDNFYEIDRANNVRTAFPVATPGISNSYQENNVFGAGEISCLGLFNDNEDDFEMPLWPLPSDTQAGPRFQPFSTDADASDALLNLQQSSVISSLPMNGYSLPPETAMQSAIHVSGSSICQSTTDINDGLVDNPVAFGSDDPLQIFLPTRPAGTSMQTDLREQTDISNGLHSEDWISLSLGGSSTTHGERAQANRTSGNQSGTVNGFSRNQFASEEIMLEPSANVASLLLSMNNNSSDRTPVKKRRSDGPFSHPRQPRSVRPRLHIPIERDSD